MSSVEYRQELFLKDTITTEEVSRICESLKMNKAGGHDRLVYENMKFADKCLHVFSTM